MHLPGEYLVGFAVLGMGVLSFYAGSHEQAEWNEFCLFEYDMSPQRRLIAKYGGVACMVLGLAVFAGLVPF